MKKTLNFITPKIIFLTLSMAIGVSAFSQTNPVLEFAAGDGNPTGNGYATSTTIQLRSNADNPTGNTFSTYTSPSALTVSAVLSNQKHQYSSTGNNAVVYGYLSTGATPIFPTVNAVGGALSSYFTSTDASTGTGIDVAQNRAVQVTLIATPLRVAGVATNARAQMADITFTFSRPVNNPILHIGGLGDRYENQLFYTDCEFLSANTPVTFNKLSGTSYFNVTTTNVTNSSSTVAGYGNGDNAGSGSVKLTGTGITTVTLRLYLKGNGGGHWCEKKDQTYGFSADAITMGFSVAESDLSITKTVDNNKPVPGTNVTFNLTATNNGLSNNTGVSVTDLLPSGYTFVSSSTATGAYDSGTGVWNIGNLNDGASATLSIVATVKSSGVFNNTASISTTSGISDPVSTNNTVTTVVNIDTDGDGVSDIDDLDNDNDGILDSAEGKYCDQTTPPNGVFPVSTSPATTPLNTKQLLFFDWSGVTLNNTTTSASKSVVFNGVTYTATVSNYNSTGSGNADMIGYDLNSWAGGPANMVWKYYNVDGTNFKEALYNPTNSINSTTLKFTVTAAKAGVNYPVDLVVFDPESTNGINESLSYTTTGSNFTLLEKIGTGTISASNIKGEGTSTITYLNTETSGVNALYVTNGYSPTVTASIIRGGGASSQGVGFAVRVYCDVDGDGIPNFLDLDSDNDGCYDAIEGDENVTSSQINANGSINIASTGGVDANGIPNLVNNGGTADIGSDQGQGIGTSQNDAINVCVGIASDDINQTPAGTAVSGNLLTNDTNLTSVTTISVNGVPTTIPAGGSATRTMTEGTIVVYSDGTYIFTPAVGYSGPVSPITYTATNVNGGSDQADLDINVVKNYVTGANNPPVASPDVATVKQGASVTVYPLTNDSDPDGTTPTVTGITALNSTGGTITLTTTPVNVYNANKVLAGTASVDASGNLIFTAASGYTGDVPFTYGITDDGTSTPKSTSTINVTVTSTPTPTVDANDDAKTAPQGKGINGNVLTNDITSVTTTVTSITINGVNHTVSSGATVTIDGKGTVIVNSDGTYTFSPLPTFTGTVPVEYTISNGTVIDKATLYLTSLPAVETTDDINQTPSGTAVSGGLLTNDKGLTSVTAATFGGNSITVDGSTVNTLSDGTTTYGTIVANSDGTYTFTPATGYTGSVPPISYTATGSAGTDNAKLYIEVEKAYNSSTNNPPVANHDVATTKQGVEVTVKSLLNDSDPDASTTLSITEIKDGKGNVITATTSGAPQTIYNADGTAVGTAYVTGGELKFTPNASYTGDVPFTYEISDGNNGTASSTINVTVLPSAATLANINANDDANVKPKDETMNGNVLTNDISSVAGLSVTGASVTIGGTTTNLTPGTASTISGVGTITLDANGDYTFDPDANFVGTVPVVYTVKNDDGSTDQATLYLTTLPAATNQVWIGTDSKDWNTGTNWKSGTVPNAGDNIVFATEVNNGVGGAAKNDLEVPSGITKEIGNLTNASTKNLIVPANTALIVNGVVSVKDPNTGVNSTDPSKIQIKAAENTANGTFIINCTAQSTPGSQRDIYVTVDLYAKGFKKTPAAEWTDTIFGSPTNGTKFTASYHWQHFGVPVETVKANPTFYGSYLRQYHEEWNKTVDPTKPSTYYAKWEDLNNESNLVAFKGYEITQDAATTYSIAGKLQYCDQTITLTRSAPEVANSANTNINNDRYGLGQNIFGNSYTASIDIDNLEFPEKVEPTVYLYNTGRFTDWAKTTGDGLNDEPTDLSAGQYTSIPQNTSPAIFDGSIPSMNGFLLIHRGYSPYYASASDVPVTMTLPYANNLLPNTKPQTAPHKPLSYMQVNLQSKSTRDNLWLFSQEGTTDKLDDGWDGRKFFGTPTAFIYTENDDGPMQVSTDETIDGSVLSFYANSDTEYTLTLTKSSLDDYRDLHLIDLRTRTVTPLTDDVTSYRFTADSKGKVEKRFIIANSRYIDLNSDKFKFLDGYVVNNNRLIITNFTSKSGTMYLFDISGKRFINTKMPVSVSEIPVTLEPGVYILDLQADGKHESIKLIIK